MVKYGISTLFIDKLLIKQLSFLEELGATTLEIWPPFHLFNWQDRAHVKKFSRELRNHHLNFCSFHMGDTGDISAKDIDTRESAIKKAYIQLDVIEDLGIRMAVIHAGTGYVDNKEMKKEKLRISKGSLEKISCYALAKKITIVLENTLPRSYYL